MAESTPAKTLTQAVATYGQAGKPAGVPTSIPPGLGTSNADTLLLEQITDLLGEAAADLANRQYANAVSKYKSAQSLIYAHLDPQWDPHLGLLPGVSLPLDADLFDPLLSAASQWLNILSVPVPVSPVRPTVQPPVQLPLSTTELHGAGLSPVSSNPAATAEAVSDVRLASIFATQGNTAASKVAAARAETEDAATADELKTAVGLSADVDTKTAGAETAAAPAAPSGGEIKGLASRLTQAVASRLPADAAAAAVNRPVTAAALTVLSDLPADILAHRQVGLVTGARPNYSVVPLQWPASGAPDISSIKQYLYTPHAVATTLPTALMSGASLWQQAVNLPYDYFCVIPIGLGRCYQGIGDYQQAVTQYLGAAQYPYINKPVEGPCIWLNLAACYLAWGDAAYLEGDTAQALSYYGNVLQPGSATAPSSALYTTPSLAVAAAIATALIPQLPALAESGVSSLTGDDTLIAAALLKVYGRLVQIDAGLDYWGVAQNSVPIWTFAYLQQVAINFTQLAQQAEQSVIDFWSQAQAAALTGSQLTGQVSQANGQVNAMKAALSAAQSAAKAYQQAVTLAKTRATDAASNATEYQSTSSQQLEEQALATETSLGNSYSGGLFWPYNSAFQMMQGATQQGDTQGQGVAEQWQAGDYSQQYQVDSMNRTTTEMQQAATQAQDQLNAANAQVTAANANLAVANLQASAAKANLAVFDADTFTPQVWHTMGEFMLTIYMGYMDQAVAVAKLMQQAYNFENDTTLTYIQSHYTGVVEGLLAADSLMADIQEFTYDLATTTRGKLQLVKTSISLATNYGYLFDTQLVPTGTMAFETSLDDFDSEYPGSYQARIQSVSVALQGIVPPTGVSGTLTNGGISWYRLPSDIASGSNVDKIRIQDVDTLVLSDYSPAVDGTLQSTDGTAQLGIFQGAGVASTWVLDLPPALNDLNYNGLTDVVLTFVYETRFDPELVPTVLATLASRPGFYARQRSIPLAWLYPDLFYAFQSTGTLTLDLAATDFPFNQTAPVVTAAGVLLTATAPSALAGVTISLATPGKGAASAATGAGGAVGSQANPALAGLTGGSALGAWTIEINAAENPGLAPGGRLDLSAFSNLTLLFEYTFTPRSS